MFLKNKNIIFKIRKSKVTDYAALILIIANDLKLSRKCENIFVFPNPCQDTV